MFDSLFRRRHFSPATLGVAISLLCASVVNGEIVEGTLKIYGDDAYPVPLRRLLPVDAPRARYPGFKQETLVLKAGTIRREGAKELPCDMLFERDVPLSLRDGTVIYTDVFRPVTNETVPALVAWSPYGKEVGGQWLDDTANRTNVPLSWVSELQKFEGPDPAYWVNQGYAILNPDPRGAYNSEGNLTYWGRQLAEDGYDFIEWAAAQSWSSGKIGMSGNSFLGISQWYIAAENPPHLTAIAPWEGATDLYRGGTRPGGVPSPAFQEAIVTTFAGHNFVEDVSRMLIDEGFMNAYWEDKIPQLEKVSVPAYVVASYTNVVHTLGTFQGYRQISSADKWLRVHNTQEWEDYYQTEYVAELTDFFDYYLKEKTNDWESTPRVRISVLDPGAEDTVNRVVSDWPVPDLANKTYYLQADGNLAEDIPCSDDSLSYSVNEHPEGITLNYTVPDLMEITGYMKLKLWVSTNGSTDMDLTVKVEKRSADGTPYAISSGSESSSTISASGTLRVSHRALDTKRSTAFEPFHPHDHEDLLEEGQIVPIEIGLWPIALRFHPGERLALTIAPTTIVSADADMGWGTQIIPVPEEGGTFVSGTNVTLLQLGGALDSNPDYVNEQRVETPKSRNNGTHFIHLGGKYDSFLLVPANITAN